VVLSGIFTTVLALAGVWWLDRNTTDFNIMGWYADYVLPVGALLVGLAAGSGYGIASWRTGLKIRRSLLWAVLGLQLGAYVTAEYIEFRDLARAAGVQPDARTFAHYYHFKATHFAWSDHGRPGQPLGAWGYFFVGLGVIGFAAGGVMAPALLARVAYCERCQMYKRSRTLAIFPASVKARRVSKKDVEGRTSYEAEQKQATEEAAARLRAIGEMTAKGDVFGLKSALAGDRAARRAAARLPVRIAISLVHCRSCYDAHLQPVSWTGHGKQQRSVKLEAIAAGPEVAKVLSAG
jgi:hypothetical protein